MASMQVDKNNDGLIDYDEFASMMYASIIDENGASNATFIVVSPANGLLFICCRSC